MTSTSRATSSTSRVKRFLGAENGVLKMGAARVITPEEQPWKGERFGLVYMCHVIVTTCTYARHASPSLLPSNDRHA